MVASSYANAVPASSPTSRAGGVRELSSSRSFQRRNEELICAYQRSHDPAGLEQVIRLNQGLLHTVLRRFQYAPEPYEDLLQVANMGLIRAVHRFDTERAVSFSSYATAMVDGEVRHYLRDAALVRQPRWLRSLKKKLDDTSLDLARRLKRPPTISEISEAANVTKEGVLEVYRLQASGETCSLDNLPVVQPNGETGVNIDTIRSRRYESFSLPLEDRIALRQAFAHLSSFQKKVVFLLFYHDLTQTEVALKLGLSQRKVSRESAKALQVMKKFLQKKIF